jgi:tetratricopeptide (TPR) repeat protein
MPMMGTGRARESSTELAIALERHGREGADAAWAAVYHAYQGMFLPASTDRFTRLDDAEAALRAADDSETLEVGLRVVSVAHLFAGENERAVSASAESLALARQGGSVDLFFAELLFHAQALVAAGRLDEADECASQALALLPHLPSDASAYVATVRGDLALARQDWPTAAAEYVSQAGQTAGVRDADVVLALQGLLLALRGLARWDAIPELLAIMDDMCTELGITGKFLPDWDKRLVQLRAEVVDAVGPSEVIAAGERGRGLDRAERIARITALASSRVPT